MNKIYILKTIDRWLGRSLANILPGPKPFILKPNKLQKVLFVRPGGIGDAILVIPAIKMVKKTFPDATIDVLAEKRNAGAFLLTPAVRKVFSYRLPQTFFALRKEKYDVVIDTEQWYRLSAVYTRLLQAPMSIGFATNERKRLFTHPIEYSLSDYELDSFLHLVLPLQRNQPPQDETAPFLEVPRSTLDAINAKVESGLPLQYVSIFPGGSVPEKRWPTERFIKLVDCLNANGLESILIGGPSEEKIAQEICDAVQCVNLVGKTSLAETAAIIDQSLLLVSGDSGVLHIAAGLGALTVSMFGPSSTQKWAPKGLRHMTVSKESDCAPCSAFGTVPKCHEGEKCLQDISLTDVTAAIWKLLKHTIDFDIKENSDAWQ